MPRISADPNLKSKLKRILNYRQNKSFLSEQNVICQERKLRGRILKPIEWTSTKGNSKKLKNKLKPCRSVVEEFKPTDVIVPKQNYVCDPSLDDGMTQADGPSQKLLLYKTIERLWYENLRIFIYHSDTVDFSGFIHPFPNLIAVQIKVVQPSTSEPELGQIISAKNFILHKSSFLKMMDSTSLDSSSHNITFILHNNNEEPTKMILSPKSGKDCELEELPKQNKTNRIDDDEHMPLDLRTFSHDYKSSTVLSRNIVNRLQRLNTVIRRNPSKGSSCSNLIMPKYGLTYTKLKIKRVYSAESILNEAQHPNPKLKLVEVIKPFSYGNLPQDHIRNNKLDDQSVIHSKLDLNIEPGKLKIDMWLHYTPTIESFGRHVSLEDLDVIPIETLFDPGEDINFEDYL